MDRLLVETDAPLSPHPYRGKRNEPERVTLVAEQIAELRGMSYEDVCRQTTENAERLFKLKNNICLRKMLNRVCHGMIL